MLRMKEKTPIFSLSSLGVPEKRLLRLPLSPKSVSWPRCGPRDEAGATAGVMGCTDIATPLTRRHFTSSQVNYMFWLSASSRGPPRSIGAVIASPPAKNNT